MNKFTYKLPKRIGTENSEELKKDLENQEIPADIAEVVLDASDLEYISSSGLRVILSFAQGHKGINLTVDDVSSSVYEIFEVTGFSELFNIRKSMKYIDVSLLQMIGRGAGGAVYKLNDEQVLKVFNGEWSRDRLDRILSNIKSAFVHGIPTIIPFETVKTDLGLGFISELVASDVLASKVHADPDNIPKYIDMMIEAAHKLLTVKLEVSDLKKYEEKIEGDLTGVEALMSEEDISMVKNFIHAVPDSFTCVHGDFHAGNIMLINGEVTLIDMDDFGRGHPMWDIAQLNPVYQICADHPDEIRVLFDLPEVVPYDDFYFKIFRLSRDEARAMYNCFMDKYFAGVSDERKQKCLKLAKCYTDCLFVRFVNINTVGRGYSSEQLQAKKQVLDKYVEDLKQYDIDEIKELFNEWPTPEEMI